MGQPDYSAARQYALERLERELDPRLSYHTLAHTRDDVLPAAERLAALAGIAGEALLVLRTAALYHDIGFTIGRVEHEQAGVQIMAQVLPLFGYTAAQIDKIGGLIMATRLPQTPHSQLEQILADADLDLLGRDDFLERNAELRRELQAFGVGFTNAEWYASQLDFLTRHRYWTSAARQLRNPAKAQNMTLLQTLAAAL